MTPSRAAARALATLAGAVLATSSCATSTEGHGRGDLNATATSAPTQVPVIRLPPLDPTPDRPPTGRLLADLRQSSRDAALGRMQVWVLNDTASEVTPARIIYRDSRYRAPVPGERLRDIPAGTERGYPLAYPAIPLCGANAQPAPTLTVRLAGEPRPRVVRAADPNRIVAGYVDRRCAELAVARVADLSFADEVEDAGDGTAVLRLRATPTGRPGRLIVDAVLGTPLLTQPGAAGWEPDLLVRGSGDPVTADLVMHPARCDEHVFMEASGATAFRVQYRLDGEPGEIILRMSDDGARNAIAYAVSACGLD